MLKLLAVYWDGQPQMRLNLLKRPLRVKWKILLTDWRKLELTVEFLGRRWTVKKPDV